MSFLLLNTYVPEQSLLLQAMKVPERKSQSGDYIKPLLVQCANAAVKSKNNPEISLDEGINIITKQGFKIEGII